MRANLIAVHPTLQVKDARHSAEFYCGKLGFTKNWEHQFEPGFPRLVSISRGSITLFLTEHPESAFGALVYFYVEDVDALCREFLERGATIDLGPADQPWEMREIQLRDVDGNTLRFGQDIPKQI